MVSRGYNLFRGGSRIFLTLVKKQTDEVSLHTREACVYYNWGFGGRFAYYATFSPEIAIS